MKKIKMILFSIMLAITILAGHNNIAFATDTSTEPVNSYTRLEAWYSDSIQPNEGDMFVLTYRVRNGEQTATIQVDGYAISNGSRQIDLPEAIYLIDDIQYKGSNDQIINEGFGVIADFTSTPTGGKIIIAIGSEQCKKLEAEYAETIIKDSKHDASGRVLLEEQIIRGNQTPEEAQEKLSEAGITGYNTEEPNLTAAMYDTSYDDNYGIEEQDPINQEPEVEYYGPTEESNNKNKSLPIKLVICFCIFVIGFAVLFTLHRKGKI